MDQDTEQIQSTDNHHLDTEPKQKIYIGVSLQPASDGLFFTTFGFKDRDFAEGVMKCQHTAMKLYEFEIDLILT